MKNEFRDKSADRILECLAEHNMSQTDLCKKTGIPKSSMSQYVHGVNTPTNVKAQLIADVFGVNPVWLMGFNVMKYLPQVKPKDAILIDVETQQIHNELNTMTLPEKQHILEYIKLYKSTLIKNKED